MEGMEEEKRDWKEEKDNWEKTIKCPHCTHQLKRKKLKKHIKNIHPSLFEEKTGDPYSAGIATGGNRSLLPRPRIPIPSQPKEPIPDYIREHIQQMVHCDPWKTKCDFCPYNGQGLSRHMLTHSDEGKKMLKEERDEIVSCPHCSHVCKKKAIRKHIKGMHPHIVGEDTHFNYPLQPQGDAQQSGWGNFPIPEVTVSLDNHPKSTQYKNLYGSFTTGEIYNNSSDSPANPPTEIIHRNVNNVRSSFPSGDMFTNPSSVAPEPSHPPPPPPPPPQAPNRQMSNFGSFTSGDIFNKSSDISDLANSNRSMNNNYNQKTNSFRPPIPGEEDKSHGGHVFNERNGTFKGNHQGGGCQNSNQGGYQNSNQGGYPESRQGGYPGSNQGGYPGTRPGAYPESQHGGYPEKNGHSGNYDEYSSGYGSQYSGDKTSLGSHNEGQPSVGPDYGYGYARNSAPWDGSSYNQQQQGGEGGHQGKSGGFQGGEGSYGWSQGW